MPGLADAASSEITGLDRASKVKFRVHLLKVSLPFPPRSSGQGLEGRISLSRPDQERRASACPRNPSPPTT